MFYLVYLFQMLITPCFGAEPNQVNLIVKIVLDPTLSRVNLQIQQGNSFIPLECGDGQQYPLDGNEDGILTCWKTGSVGQYERLRILSNQLSYPLFYDLIDVPNQSSIPVVFQVRKSGSRWVAERTTLGTHSSIRNLQNASREWLIGFWSLLIANLLLGLLWLTKNSAKS